MLNEPVHFLSIWIDFPMQAIRAFSPEILHSNASVIWTHLFASVCCVYRIKPWYTVTADAFPQGANATGHLRKKWGTHFNNVKKYLSSMVLNIQHFLFAEHCMKTQKWGLLCKNYACLLLFPSFASYFTLFHNSRVPWGQVTVCAEFCMVFLCLWIPYRFSNFLSKTYLSVYSSL